MIREYARASSLVLLVLFCAVAGVSSLPGPTEAARLLPKLDSRLARMITLYEMEGRGSVRDWAQRLALEAEIEGDLVRVEIELQSHADLRQFVRSLQLQGARPEVFFDRWVQALVPIRLLPELALRPAVRFIQFPVELERDQGKIVSEGVARSGAQRWHEAGFRGQGAKVVIIDSGFEGYRTLLGTELPREVVVQSFRADGNIEAGERHGTAVAEIVYDMAPEAQLLLANVRTRTEWGRAVEWAISQGATGLTSSLSSPPECPGDSRTLGSVASRARENGILWTTSAGNLGANHWGGPWHDGDGNNILNFTDSDETINIVVSRDQTFYVALTWDDPCGQSANDYDLFLLDDQGRVVESSTNIQNGSGIPNERIDYRPRQSGTLQIQVRSKPGAKPALLDIYNRYVTQAEYIVPAGSIQDPGLSPNIMAVGAINVRDGSLERFSSRGPTRDGRPKPDISGHNRVSTQTYGANSFAGTSASTPQAAGAAALVKSAFPDWTAAQIQQFLESRAEDRGLPGKDSDFGAGELFLGNVPHSSPATLELSTTLLTFQATQNGAVPDPQSVAITNGGSGTFSWQAQADAPWVKLSPAEGAVPPPSSLTVSVETAGLPTGQYETKILITAPGITNAPQAIRVVLKLQAQASFLIALQFLQLALMELDLARRLEGGCVRYTRPAGALRLQMQNAAGLEEYTVSGTTGALVCRESVLLQSLGAPTTLAQIANTPWAALKILKLSLGDAQGWETDSRDGCFVLTYTLPESRAIQVTLSDQSRREFLIAQGSELILCNDVLHLALGN